MFGLGVNQTELQKLISALPVAAIVFVVILMLSGLAIVLEKLEREKRYTAQAIIVYSCILLVGISISLYTLLFS